MTHRALSTCLALICLAPATGGAAEVLIGYFGPSGPEGGDLWRAAQMAVDEANARGGYRGRPFRLAPAWSRDPWGTGVAQLTRLVYRDRVCAIVGGIDGPSTHLAEQVVAKARLPLISAVSTDKTASLANVPWMFSCLPGDDRLAGALAKAIVAQVGRRPLVLLASDAHDPRQFAVELKKALDRDGVAPAYEFQCRRGATDAAGAAERAVRARAAGIVISADAGDSARLAIAVREAGFTGRVFGGPAMGRRRFVERAGRAAEGAVFPLGAKWPVSAVRRWQPPDYAAAQTYDAVRLLVAAIGTSGPDRARIAAALRELSPWTGLAGVVKWDSRGRNTRAPGLATIRKGSAVLLQDRR